MRTTHKPHAFTLIELLVVISIIALLIAILLPALGAARTTARKMASSTQLRGTAQAIFTYANDNDTFGPGIEDGKGKNLNDLFTDDNRIPDYSYSSFTRSAGRFVGARYAILFGGDYITPDYAISPAENNPEVQPFTPDQVNDQRVPPYWYSYGMSQLEYSGRIYESKIQEWSVDANPLSVMMSDRVSQGDPHRNEAQDTAESLWTEKKNLGWEGGVVFGDGHTEIINRGVLDRTVKYGQYTNNNVPDHIFLDLNDNAMPDQEANTKIHVWNTSQKRFPNDNSQ